MSQSSRAEASAVFCNICELSTPLQAVERASVRSNLRRFRSESFEMWRCPGCRSIHALDEVDLAHYYAGYPIFDIPEPSRSSLIYGNMLRRLRAGGLKKTDRILDYGCGSGTLLKYLRLRGYTQAFGYDAYSAQYTDRAVLNEHYDCVISQDVIEHVESPKAFLRELDQLAKPQALIAIGTPDALALDLAQPEAFVHALHAPFHRHILSRTMLQQHAEAQGWRVARFYPRMYTCTIIPGENNRFGLHYLRSQDNCLDVLNEPPRLSAGWLLHPTTLFLAVFGYFFDLHADIMFTFRKGS